MVIGLIMQLLIISLILCLLGMIIGMVLFQFIKGTTLIVQMIKNTLIPSNALVVSYLCSLISVIINVSSVTMD
jgi:hypothetical protein